MNKQQIAFSSIAQPSQVFANECNHVPKNRLDAAMPILWSRSAHPVANLKLPSVWEKRRRPIVAEHMARDLSEGGSLPQTDHFSRKLQNIRYLLCKSVRMISLTDVLLNLRECHDLMQTLHFQIGDSFESTMRKWESCPSAFKTCR